MATHRRRKSSVSVPVPLRSLSSEIGSTSPSHWEYTAEGGANLVVSYAGPPSLQLDGKVLRLRKRKKIGHTNAGTVDLRFAQEVIGPLLGNGTIVRMEKARVPTTFLRDIKSHLHTTKARPAEREEIDDIDDDMDEVVLTDDLVRGIDVLAVEIKPKWGFLPSSRFLSEATARTKIQYCRFCMHACYKKKQKSETNEAILERSQHGFCPLQLYSGRNPATTRAVEALWRDWDHSDGKANNLRLFLEGDRISPRDFQAMTRLHRFLSSATGTDVKKGISSMALLGQTLIPALLASPVLPTLSLLQSSLDPLDIEGLENLILERTGATSLEGVLTEGSLGEQPTVEEWVQWRDLWMSAATVPPAQRETRDLVLAYLLSATMKDCSIFVRLQLVNGYGPPDVLVKAIDLDPKPLARLARYRDLDRDIVEAFQALLADGVPLQSCRDQST